MRWGVPLSEVPCISLLLQDSQTQESWWEHTRCSCHEEPPFVGTSCCCDSVMNGMAPESTSPSWRSSCLQLRAQAFRSHWAPLPRLLNTSIPRLHGGQGQTPSLRITGRTEFKTAKSGLWRWAEIRSKQPGGLQSLGLPRVRHDVGPMRTKGSGQQRIRVCLRWVLRLDERERRQRCAAGSREWADWEACRECKKEKNYSHFTVRFPEEWGHPGKLPVIVIFWLANLQ